MLKYVSVLIFVLFCSGCTDVSDCHSSDITLSVADEFSGTLVPVTKDGTVDNNYLINNKKYPIENPLFSVYRMSDKHKYVSSLHIFCNGDLYWGNDNHLLYTKVENKIIDKLIQALNLPFLSKTNVFHEFSLSFNVKDTYVLDYCQVKKDKIFANFISGCGFWNDGYFDPNEADVPPLKDKKLVGMLGIDHNSQINLLLNLNNVLKSIEIHKKEVYMLNNDAKKFSEKYFDFSIFHFDNCSK